MKIVVIGTGFVGVVTAAVLASFGNHVIGLDIDPQKVARLSQGDVPFFEPGLEDLLKESLETGRLRFDTEYGEAIPDADVILVAVGTPSAPDGTADLTYVKKACESLAPYLKEQAIVGIKSTVPPGTLNVLRPLFEERTQATFALASLPEFLREGTAVHDTLHPDRVVIGCNEPWAQAILAELHAPFHAPVIFVRPESAQMGKYAANSYLATRITFINQVADLCEQNGADVQEVIEVIGHDKRIGQHYWYPGLGYGGSCFPKDVRELAAYSRSVGYGNNLFNKVSELNENRIFEVLSRLETSVGGWEGKRIAVLGLSFKPHTDDMREAPSLYVIPQLLHAGAQVVGYDPMAIPAAKQFLGERSGLSFADSLPEAVQDCDGIFLLVEWPELVQFSYESLGGNGRLFFDARNQLQPEKLTQSGWNYKAVGRT